MKLHLVLLFLTGIFFLGCAHRQTIQDSHELQSEADRPRAFLISEPTRNDGASLDYDLFPATIRVSQAIVDSLEQDQRLIFVGSKEAFQRLKTGLILHTTSRLEHIEAPAYFWLQDLFEVYKKADGTYVLGVPWVNARLKGIADTIAKAIGGSATVVGTARNYADRTLPPAKPGFEFEGHHGVVGGNFERWSDQVGFIGLSDFPDSAAAEEFSKIAFPKRIRGDVLPTSWLYLGHVDEVVKPVLFEKWGEKGCRVTAIVANPGRALTLLDASPETVIHDASSIGRKKFKEVLVYKDLCKRMGLKACAPFSWKKLAGSKVFGADFISVQKAIALQLETLRDKIETSLREKSSCSVTWIDAPALYLGELDAQGALKRRYTRPLFPNPTNGLVVGSSYVVLDQENELFRADLKKQLGSHGLHARFVEAGELLHGGGWSDGYIHCMTQVLR